MSDLESALFPDNRYPTPPPPLFCRRRSLCTGLSLLVPRHRKLRFLAVWLQHNFRKANLSHSIL